jgi:hypothetical protein
MTDVSQILDDRGKRYGNYLMQARITDYLRTVIVDRLTERWVGLESDQLDAINMICVKLARIANGDPDYADNWRDIAGYATLVADRLDGKERP